MNAKIKSYTPWIIVGLIAVVLFLAEYLLSSVYGVLPYNSWIYSLISSIITPGVVILQHITIETINWFGGGEPSSTAFVRSASIVLTGILFLLIILPWFFLKGRLASSPENQDYPIYWYFSAAFLSLAIILVSINEIRHTKVMANNKQSMETSRTLDKLRSYMAHVAFDASEWWILPEEEGGGGGTFRPADRDIFALSMVSSYEADHDSFNIVIDGEPTDSTLTLAGTVHSANDEESDHKVTLEVTPMNDSLFKFLNTSR